MRVPKRALIETAFIDKDPNVAAHRLLYRFQDREVPIYVRIDRDGIRTEIFIEFRTLWRFHMRDT
jgi:hypothetical protein